MHELVCLSIKRVFSSTSDNGRVFYWLRYSEEVSFDAAINEALRIVYLPSALGEDSENLGRVPLVREQSIQDFEQWMNASTTTPVQKGLPKNVYINHALQFPKESDHGKTLNWILQNFGENAVTEIVWAVQLVYLPIVLSAFADQQHRIPSVVRRSLQEFKNRRGYDIQPAFQDSSVFSSNGHSTGFAFEVKSVEAEVMEPTHTSTQTQTLEKEPEPEPKAEEYLGEAFFDIDLDAAYESDDD